VPTARPGPGGLEDLLRDLAPQVLGALVRRYGNFDAAEDAVQLAMIAAGRQWPDEGVPDDPRGWLIRVASRRLIDLLRSDQARRRREDTTARWAAAEPAGGGPGTNDRPDGDDTLILLLMCCHPSVSTASQIGLTLRAVGGLTTSEIARAFLVPDDTMTRRISRAKQTIRSSGIPFRLPASDDLESRVSAVLRVLYLVFTEGYAATSGSEVHRRDLALEAIRLARLVHRSLPDDCEAAGLLALMLLTDARRPARTRPDGALVPMAEQDRSSWDREMIGEGIDLLTATLADGDIGPYQVQAAIAAVHDEAPSAPATDWGQIVALYDLLLETGDNPIVRLNHAVAVAMARGPSAGLVLMTPLVDDPRLANDHRVHAARAQLLELAGDHEAARAAYQVAIGRTANLMVRRHLVGRAAALEPDTP